METFSQRGRVSRCLGIIARYTAGHERLAHERRLAIQVWTSGSEIITMRLNVLINEFGINSLPGGEVLSVLNRHEDRTSQEHLFNFD